MTDEYKYISFPLPMIRKFLTEPNKAAAEIIDYGIFRTAMGLKISVPESPYRQLTYDFIMQGCKMPSGDSYRVSGSLSHRLVKLMNEEGYLESLDYNGFSFEDNSAQFVCDDDITLLMEIADNEELFKNEVIEWYRLRQVQDVIGVEFDVSEHQAIKETYNRVESSFLGEPQVPVSCKTSIILERQDNQGTEHERARLCLYLGIRSLIGKSDIAITTGQAIQGRMFGAKNQEELSAVLKDKKLLGIYEKWCTRYQYDKLLTELRIAGMVNKISYGRNTIVTCSLQDDNEFMEAIKTRLNAAKDAEDRRKLKEREKVNRDKLRALLEGSDSQLEIMFANTVDN